MHQEDWNKQPEKASLRILVRASRFFFSLTTDHSLIVDIFLDRVAGFLGRSCRQESPGEFFASDKLLLTQSHSSRGPRSSARVRDKSTRAQNPALSYFCLFANGLQRLPSRKVKKTNKREFARSPRTCS